MLKIERFFRYGRFDIGEVDFQLWNTDSATKQWLGTIVDDAFFNPEKDVYVHNIKVTIEIEEMISEENE